MSAPPLWATALARELDARLAEVVDLSDDKLALVRLVVAEGVALGYHRRDREEAERERGLYEARRRMESQLRQTILGTSVLAFASAAAGLRDAVLSEDTAACAVAFGWAMDRAAKVRADLLDMLAAECEDEEEPEPEPEAPVEPPARTFKARATVRSVEREPPPPPMEDEPAEEPVSEPPPVADGDEELAEVVPFKVTPPPVEREPEPPAPAQAPEGKRGRKRPTGRRKSEEEPS